jgi:DNA repair exonuclease SbcCD ATPase subunit
MDPQVLDAIADFGALGLASGAIFWMYVRMSKRMEVQTDNFQQQLREQMEQCHNEQQALRDRFDAVVEKYDTERLQWTGRLDSIEKELKDVEAILKEGLGEMRNHYAKISAVLGRQV